MRIEGSLLEGLDLKDCKKLAEGIKQLYETNIKPVNPVLYNEDGYYQTVVGVHYNRAIDVYSLRLVSYRDAEKSFFSIKSLENYLNTIKEKTVKDIKEGRLAEVIYDLLKDEYDKYIRGNIAS